LESMRIPLTIIYAAALLLFAPLSFSSPEYLSQPENYLWETNESQTGQFVLRLEGDGGSSVTVNYQFYGFYVGYFFGTLDKLIPIKTNIKMSGVIRDVSGNTERIEKFYMKSQVYSDVPTMENSYDYTAPFEINWRFGRRPEFVSTAFRVDQGVLKLSNSYGEDPTHPASFSGTVTTMYEVGDGCEIDEDESTGTGLQFRISDTDFDKDFEEEAELNKSLTSVKVPSLQLPEAIKTEDGYKFSYQLKHRFDRDGGSDESHCIVGDGDRFVDVDMKLDVNFLHETEMYLSPMIYETEAKWMPTPGDIRFYRLHLKKTFGEIEAIQFGLDEVSEHPGVATNAGYYKHCLIPPRQTDEERWETDGVISDRSEQSCPDLGGELSADDWYTSVMYKSKYSVPNKFDYFTFDRSYRKFNKSPIDNMPDVFFTDLDQEPIADHYPDIEYTIVDPKHYDPGKGYSYSYSDKVEIIQQLRQIGKTDHLAWGNAYHVFVRIMDYGASARLFADIKIEGEWQRATAWGDNAYGEDYGDYYGDYLLIPNDQNRDGIQDQWARARNVSDPLEDLDTHAKAQFLGDGLTAFEEYRGLIYDNTLSRSQLTHYRTNPAEKQIFVHPFESDVTLTRLLLQGVSAVQRTYHNGGVELVVLDGDEFEDEIVNYNETKYRLGSQFAIVAMTLPQFLRVTYQSESPFKPTLLGRAAHVGPPLQNANTALNIEGNNRTLAHEIGHQVNIHHPGNNDVRLIMDDRHHYIAVKHGQHSGNVQSIMRYRAADYFCDSHQIMCKAQAWLGEIHEDWILVKWGTESPDLYILSQDEKGTGANSNNAMAGDAVNGGDLPQLNVKSY